MPHGSLQNVGNSDNENPQPPCACQLDLHDRRAPAIQVGSGDSVLTLPSQMPEPPLVDLSHLSHLLSAGNTQALDQEHAEPTPSQSAPPGLTRCTFSP